MSLRVLVAGCWFLVSGFWFLVFNGNRLNQKPETASTSNQKRHPTPVRASSALTSPPWREWSLTASPPHS